MRNQRVVSIKSTMLDFVRKVDYMFPVRAENSPVAGQNRPEQVVAESSEELPLLGGRLFGGQEGQGGGSLKVHVGEGKGTCLVCTRCHVEQSYVVNDGVQVQVLVVEHHLRAVVVPQAHQP